MVPRSSNLDIDTRSSSDQFLEMVLLFKVDRILNQVWLQIPDLMVRNILLMLAIFRQ